MHVATRLPLNREAHEMAMKRNVFHPNKPTAGLSGTPAFHLSQPQMGTVGRRMIPRFSRFGFVWLALALALAFVPGCNRNKSRQVPPQATVPAIAVPPTAQAGQHPAPPVQTTPPPATKAETGAIPQPSAAQTNSKPKPQKNSARKPAPAATKQAPQAQAAQPAQPPPQKSPAPGGSEGQVQIAAQAPQGMAQNTEQLLQVAEGNLRKVTRQLSDGEQAMLRQARNYILQSRSASQDGDLERAYNLAMKANLLSGELAK
jgi:hypothetical protein